VGTAGVLPPVWQPSRLKTSMTMMTPTRDFVLDIFASLHERAPKFWRAVKLINYDMFLQGCHVTFILFRAIVFGIQLEPRFPPKAEEVKPKMITVKAK
jgi:hypothetical protein